MSMFVSEFLKTNCPHDQLTVDKGRCWKERRPQVSERHAVFLLRACREVGCMLDLLPDQPAKKSQGLLTEGLWSGRTDGGVVQWDTNLISTGWVTCSLGLKHPDRKPSQSMYSRKKRIVNEACKLIDIYHNLVLWPPWLKAALARLNVWQSNTAPQLPFKLPW